MCYHSFYSQPCSSLSLSSSLALQKLLWLMVTGGRTVPWWQGGKWKKTGTGGYHIKRSLLTRKLSFTNAHTCCQVTSFHINMGIRLVNCPADVFLFFVFHSMSASVFYQTATFNPKNSAPEATANHASIQIEVPGATFSWKYKVLSAYD